MTDIEKVKDDYAKEHNYKNFNDLVMKLSESPGSINWNIMVTEISKRYKELEKSEQ